MTRAFVDYLKEHLLDAESRDYHLDNLCSVIPGGSTAIHSWNEIRMHVKALEVASIEDKAKVMIMKEALKDIAKETCTPYATRAERALRIAEEWEVK